MTIDEQLERTHHMFCGVNDGWRVTFCGYDVDINLDPQIYFTHMKKILQEITTFCLQWPYGVSRIVINCQLTEHSLILDRLKYIKQLTKNLEWMDELLHYLPHKKVIYDFSNIFVAFPLRMLQRQYT